MKNLIKSFSLVSAILNGFGFLLYLGAGIALIVCSPNVGSTQNEKICLYMGICLTICSIYVLICFIMEVIITSILVKLLEKPNLNKSDLLPYGILHCIFGEGCIFGLVAGIIMLACPINKLIGTNKENSNEDK